MPSQYNSTEQTVEQIGQDVEGKYISANEPLDDYIKNYMQSCETGIVK
jgi:hypothetical protein